MRTICPKCSSESAWFEYTEREVVLRCTCGFHGLMQTHLGEVVIEMSEKPEDVTLPRQGTKLWQCLHALLTLQSANTTAITAQVNVENDTEYDTNEVSSHLTVLRYKGLVIVTEYRKGLPGGSTWTVTPASIRLMGEVKGEVSSH